MSKKTLLNAKQIDITLHRLACQLVENHKDFSKTVLIGIQPRGSAVLHRLSTILTEEYGINQLNTGYLDITFYRDDFRRREKPLQANTTQINVLLENKRIVLIDDVLFTGRSIRAALTAIESYGRPDDIELLVLIDRRFSRNLPIQPTYKGKQVDAFNDEKVLVRWGEKHSDDIVYVIPKNTTTS
jgi:pyrimidine operon attenuation protein/uracil phosphoribosyltransferase